MSIPCDWEQLPQARPFPGTVFEELSGLSDNRGARHGG
jgi:hypothetical protein